ncbi:MAG: hypothetical protein KBS81_06185 [Spirochaetales bacterium]|nr:hypothetical protein [Candidatus Physcosoma equi]
MKKLFLVLLALAVLFAFASCDANKATPEANVEIYELTELEEPFPYGAVLRTKVYLDPSLSWGRLATDHATILIGSTTYVITANPKNPTAIYLDDGEDPIEIRILGETELKEITAYTVVPESLKVAYFKPVEE